MVYKDIFVTALINSFFVKNNPGHVIIVPNKHFENIYDLPKEYATQINQAAKKVAIALKKAYGCEGITLLQNNEPAGGQHAFHYHLHIFPRYENDKLHKHMLKKISTTPEERRHYAQKLKEALG